MQATEPTVRQVAYTAKRRVVALRWCRARKDVYEKAAAMELPNAARTPKYDMPAPPALRPMLQGCMKTAMPAAALTMHAMAAGRMRSPRRARPSKTTNKGDVQWIIVDSERSSLRSATKLRNIDVDAPVHRARSHICEHASSGSAHPKPSNCLTTSANALRTIPTADEAVRVMNGEGERSSLLIKSRTAHPKAPRMTSTDASSCDSMATCQRPGLVNQTCLPETP
mmetsp:Transcript_53548/g.162639  ORF Transcript_53548/g.162639 Transcript_53548/m.162639 type:complete len:225 (+) Transcript_53548:128-802(+)